jgi:hypothetical protein
VAGTFLAQIELESAIVISGKQQNVESSELSQSSPNVSDTMLQEATVYHLLLAFPDPKIENSGLVESSVLLL